MSTRRAEASITVRRDCVFAECDRCGLTENATQLAEWRLRSDVSTPMGWLRMTRPGTYDVDIHLCPSCLKRAFEKEHK